jgi:hypothetical protein
MLTLVRAGRSSTIPPIGNVHQLVHESLEFTVMALIFPNSSWLPSRSDQQPSCVLPVKLALGFEGNILNLS